MRSFAVLATLLILVLGSVPGAGAHAIRVGPYSQQVDRGHARIGGSVEVTSQSSGEPAASEWSTPSSSSSGGSSEGTTNGWPTLSSDAPILDDPTPEGDGTFWMVGVNGQPCIYNAASNGICFNVTTPGTGGPGTPGIDPRVLAERAAQRLPLLPGSIVASPSRQAAGLTGAPSWFWLDPAPGTEALTVALESERVTVTAAPSKIVWAFGDGKEVDGGPGRPYRERAERAGSIRHVYRTRCLPGDQGRNPYVLASCTNEGYAVEASVEWTISFEAVGPIEMAGALPPRTTSTTIDYPVSEVRGFLAGGGAR